MTAVVCPNLSAFARTTVAAFLKSLDDLTFTGPDPLDRVDYRHQLAECVLDELNCYCAECRAVDMIAAAVRDLTFSPRDRGGVERYLAARRAHIDAVNARAR